jgi:hypothetical protein
MSIFLIKVGMKVEYTDLMDPRFVCVGTISRVSDTKYTFKWRLLFTRRNITRDAALKSLGLQIDFKYPGYSHKMDRSRTIKESTI